MDDTLFRLLNRSAGNSLFDAVFPTLTNLHKQVWFLVPAVLFLFLSVRRWKKRAVVAAVCMVVAAGLSDVTTVRLMKRGFDRPRPCSSAAGGGYSFPDVRMVPGEHCPGSPSFPSSHAANTAAVAAVGVMITRSRRRWWWLLLPMVIGYTRIYLGVHYPSDVLGGWAAGGVVGGAVAFAACRLFPPPQAEDVQPDEQENPQ
jgi:undecaprenyl-diphosphatase